MKKFMAVIGTALAAVLLTLGLFGCTKPSKVKIIDIDLTNEQYAFGVQKDNVEVLTAANELISEMIADGTIDALVAKYQQEDTSDFVQFTNPATKDLSTQLVVITSPDFPPFESYYEGGNKLTGIDIEIAIKLAEKLNKELYIQDGSFESVLNQVSAGQAHIAMAGLTITEERKQSVTFTNPYYTDVSEDKPSQLLIVREDDTTFDGMNSVEQIVEKLKSFDSNVKIGYQQGTTGEFYVTTKNFIPEGLKVTGKPYDKGALAVKDLSIGRINYVIIDKLPAREFVNSINKDIT